MTENTIQTSRKTTAQQTSRDENDAPIHVPRRCDWAGTDPLYQAYHDHEWGRSLRGETPVFEKISLEGFQAGLSWITILRRREGFRTAFHGFDVDAVARFDHADVERLMLDPAIIRNRAKIEATVSNANAVLRLRSESSSDVDALENLLWSFAPPRSQRPADASGVPAITEESTALSAELKRRGFRFVGPTTCYALMQSAGLINDHVIGCEAGDQIDSGR